MIGYRGTEVFDKSLWIIAYEQDSKRPVGCGIADLDSELKEGILEWIQVLPGYRNRGIGQMIVSHLLCEIRVKASFATVSGRAEDVMAERLYRKCGFSGNDLWHILYKI